MGNDIIQARYDQLEAIARRFGQQARVQVTVDQSVQRGVQALQDGGWEGRGATAFFQEMNAQVLPAMKRLTTALQEGNRVTLQIANVMKEAEEEAARPFRSHDQAAAIGGGQAGDAHGGATEGPSAAESTDPEPTTPQGPEQSGPFHIGPPQRPPIRHDNGFLDQFAPREPSLGDHASLLIWRAKLEGSEVLRPDLVDANAAYRHFLDGGGSDRTFSYERYVENDANGQTTLRNLIVDAQRHVEIIGQGRSQFSMTSDAYAAGGGDARFPYPETENWQKTIGAHSLWTNADVQVTGTAPDRTYAMTIVVHAEDRYNFNPGAADIATGIPDSDNGAFEITGLAHQYMNYGQLTRVVTWREGDIPNARVVDTDTSRNRLPDDNRRARNRL